MNRLFVSMVLVGAAGCVAGCDGGPARSAPTSAASSVAVATSVVPSPGSVGIGLIISGTTCAAAPSTPAPDWVAEAGGGLPDRQVRSVGGDVVAALFVDPLRAAPRDDGMNNKILFIVGKPRNGKPLIVTATPARGGAAVTTTTEANAAPGEIYPSIVDVPAAGCWHLVLTWDGHTDSMDLRYTS
jgi:hypothetical protein